MRHSLPSLGLVCDYSEQPLVLVVSPARRVNRVRLVQQAHEALLAMMDKMEPLVNEVPKALLVRTVLQVHEAHKGCKVLLVRKATPVRMVVMVTMEQQVPKAPQDRVSLLVARLTKY